MKIRRLQPNEWPVLRDLRLRAATESPFELGETVAELRARTTDEYWIRQANDDGQAIFVVWKNEVLSGLIYAETQISDVLAEATFAALWLDPILRGRGIGRQLLCTAIDWVKTRGATHGSLLVVEGNQQAIEFFQREGFTKTSPFPIRQFWRMERQFS